ncbi:MAG: ABC transporter permease [Sagittula sp.]|jgi:spermidine/putrescine transport system permease protein|uniref:ABC transporter permease n=1 Tax=unclassified Sagittula TaxID=2624628 RepID=UPI000C2CFF24|nr:ABC transporter permease [Sagittula sp. P11]AUC53795.1 spermidine/putrescine ABC transporter permease [Sagittula sp. P11]
MSKPAVYPYVWRLPLLIWQGLFFLGPLVLMVAMSFWLVRNYRMEPAFVFDNWDRMLGRDYFWNAYWVTLWRATLAAVLSTLIAFPAAFALAFRVSETTRRWAVFFLIVPFFTSYLVRVYAWQVLLAESGPLNAIIGGLGLGPFTMLNSGFGAMVGYLTLVLPLVVILQTFSLAAIDRNLIEAARNLGASPRATLTQVILPAAKVGLIVGAVFAFILSFGDFVSPFYLGGSKPPTLSILIIDTTKSGQQWPRAAVVAIMMIVTLFTVAFAAVGAAYGRRK